MRGARSKLMALLFTLTVGSLFASTSFAQILWQGTSYGMSLGEVKKLFPGAREFSEEAQRREGHFLHYDQSVELLRLPQVELVGREFEARFYFKSQRLTQVTLALREGPGFYEASLIFDRLAEALRTRYGTEIDRRSTQSSRSATWLSGSTNITMSVSAIGSYPAMLNVAYQLRVAKDAKQL